MADEEKAEERDSEADDGAGGKTGEEKQQLDFESTKSALKETRKEAAANRVEAKALREELATLKKGLAQALGIGGKGEESSDVKELTKQVQALTSKLSTTERREAFRTVAAKLGADPDLTWAYLAAEGSLDGPDVDVQALVKAALKSKPQLKVGQVVSTGDEGAGGGRGKTKDMNAFIRRAAGR